jgi:hypothetical protein
MVLGELTILYKKNPNLIFGVLFFIFQKKKKFVETKFNWQIM